MINIRDVAMMTREGLDKTHHDMLCTKISNVQEEKAVEEEVQVPGM